MIQAWPKPSRPLPIVIIGAGGIVRDAHLPAYRRLGLTVAALVDVNEKAAAELAAGEKVPAHGTRVADFAGPDQVYDVAVPASALPGVLAEIPEGSAVLMQKPMGENLQQAKHIVRICRDRGLRAAVNFQLRFAPNMLALAGMIRGGELGELTDVDLRVVIDQPWAMWSFLEKTPRVEVLYHSIHYLDWIRSILGEPKGVYAKGLRHPELSKLADTRGSIVLDYGDKVRCSLVMNHTHRRGRRQHRSEFLVEGLQGAARASMGVNLNYPQGEADELEVSLGKGDWQSIALRGSWFTEAFEGPMSNLQRFAAGEDDSLVSPVEDALRTMAVVEACYQSSQSGATPLPETGLE